jgi:hypothetical protein
VKKLDISGEKYGLLTAIAHVESEGKDTKWKFKCDCGNVVIKHLGNVRNGHTKSCGCLKHKKKDVVDLTGKRFGRLVVDSFDCYIDKGYKWNCTCDCGKATSVIHYSLIRGSTKSCGCLSSEKARDRNYKGRDNYTYEYNSWRNMKSRCTNRNNIGYKDYGGRGITICDRWIDSFDNFLCDMGERPEPKEKYSIDRIDVNGNYEPSNCRWATINVQNHNRRITAESGYRGVFKNRDKWFAKIYVNNDYIFSESRETPEEAAMDYNKMAIEIHGNNAALNIIKEDKCD